MEKPPETSQPPDPCHRDANTQDHRYHNGGIMAEDDQTQTTSKTRFLQLLEGLDAPGDSGNPSDPPEWLDRDLFDRGRAFYKRYLFCVFLSDLVALLAMFSVTRILQPLIYTRRSDTPFKALRRYVSTIGRVVLWYSGDLWQPQDPAHEDILKVRRIHVAAAATFNHPDRRDALHSVTASGGKNNPDQPACPFHAPLKQDISKQVRKEEGQAESSVMARLEARPGMYLSQWDMTFTQYCFMGVIMAHPWRMGAWWVTERELEGLVHFWRGCGWLLGIEDRYNFCSGTVEETRALCLEMERQVVRPCLARSGRDTEHIGTALVDGVSSLLPWFSYPAMLRFLGDTMNLDLPSVRARMTLKHTLQYGFLRVLVHGLFLVPGVVWVFNEVLKLSLAVVQGQHPRWKAKVRVMPYSYVEYT